MKNGKASKRILSVTIKRMIDDSPDTSWLGEYASKPTSEYSIDRAHSEDCASQTYNHQTIEAKRILEHVQETIGDLHNAILAQYNGTLANEKLDMEREELDAAYNEVGELLDAITECDCGERGDMERNQYRYFNPSFNYVDSNGHALPENTAEEVRSYVKQDYERMESLNAGHWCFIGIRAEAILHIPYMTEGRGGRTYFKSEPIASGGLWGIESDSGDSYLQEVEEEELADLREQLKAIGFSSRAISQAFKNVERKED